MTLGNLLANIAETEGNTREQWKAEFLKRIQGHKEEKLLRECFEAACSGQKHISLGRKTLPPAELEGEGFEVEATACGFSYCFE